MGKIKLANSKLIEKKKKKIALIVPNYWQTSDRLSQVKSMYPRRKHFTIIYQLNHLQGCGNAHSAPLLPGWSWTDTFLERMMWSKHQVRQSRVWPLCPTNSKCPPEDRTDPQSPASFCSRTAKHTQEGEPKTPLPYGQQPQHSSRMDSSRKSKAESSKKGVLTSENKQPFC